MASKSPREIITSEDYQPDPVKLPLQRVRDREENRARSQFLPSSDQVSNRFFAVLQRFTGQMFVAKSFEVNLPRRDEEFLMFNKKKVDASIVQYLQSTEVANIPIVISQPHQEYASYNFLREGLIRMHPNVCYQPIWFVPANTEHQFLRFPSYGAGRLG
jgi:hypothetical protein